MPGFKKKTKSSRKSSSKKPDQLTELIENLTAAEKALQNVIDNQLDAIVIEGKLFLLQSARDALHQSKELLQLSDKRFRSILENSNDVILLIDENGLIQYTSPSIEGLLGYSSKEKAGRNIFENIHEDDLPGVKQVFFELTQKFGSIINETVRYRHKNGTWRWIESYAKNLLDDPVIKAIIVNFRDVTDSRVAKQKLLENERQLSILMGNLPGMAYRCRNDRNWTVEFISSGCFALTGYHPEQLMSEHISYNDIIHPDDRERVWNEVQDALNINVGFQITYRIQTVTGIVKWVWEQGCGIYDKDGNLLVLEGFITDVTERIYAREYERKFARIIDQTDDAVLITDPEGTIEYVNKAFEKITGYTSVEAVGRKPSLVKSGLHGDKFYSNLWQTIKSGKSFKDTFINRKKDGEIFYEQKTITPLIDDDGKITHFVSTSKDITYKKLAEEALRESEKKYKTLVETANTGYLILDGEGRVLTANKEYVRLTGHNKLDDIIGRKVTEWTAEHDLERNAEEVKKCMEKGYVRNLEIDYVNKDGKHTTIDINATVIQTQDGPQILSICRDVTERRKNQEALQASKTQLSIALTLARAGHWQYDVINDTFTFNEHFYAIFRTTVEKEGSYTMSSAEYAKRFVHPDDTEVVSNEIQTAIESTDPDYTHELEHRIIYADGEVGYIAVRIFTIKDEKGHTIKTYGVNQDITNRVKSAEALRKSETRLRAILENEPECVKLVSTDGCLLDMNAAGLRMIDVDDLDEVIGQPIVNLVHPDDRGLFEEIHNQACRGIQSGGQFRIIGKKGTLRWMEIHSTPFESEGKITSVLSVTRDITERKRAEEELHESESKLREAQEMAHLGYWHWNVKTGEVNWSGEVYRIFRLDPEEFTPQIDSIMALSPWPDDNQRHREIVADAMNSREQGAFEQRFLRPDGSTGYYYSTFKGVYDENGDVIAMKGTVQDITRRKEAEATIRENEEKLRLFIERAPSAIAMFDNNMRYLAYSNRWLSDYDLGDRDITGLSHYEVFPEIPERWKEIHRRCLSGVIEKCDEDMFQRSDGRIEWNRWEIVPWRKSSGEVGGIIIFSEVITERKESRDKILRLNRVYRMLSEINSLIVHVQDRQELFQEACRISVEDGEFLLAWIGVVDEESKRVKHVAYAGIDNGYLDDINISLDPAEPGGSGPTAIAIRENRAFVCNDIESDPCMDYWRKRALARGFKSSAAIPLMVSGDCIGTLNLYARETFFFNEDELKLLLELTTDISYALRNIIQKEKLDYLASYDQLTGLANRSIFNDHLNSVLQRAGKGNKKVALLVCDLKQFRNINNVYGRATGDEILQETARRLRQLTSDPVNIGRITSDYFAMILHDFGKSTGIAYMFENILFPSLNKPFIFGGNEIQVKICGGIAVYPADGNDADTLYRNAEAALKKAKLSSEQYLFYQPEMTARIAETLQIENKLRSALKENQFVLYYQPKINSVTHKIVGLEALLRWNDPETGLVSPGTFIPILEETGLILDVGLWALDRVATDYRQWKSKLKNIPRIAVNISSIQLHQKSFVEDIEKAIRHGGEAVSMDLEITESMIMSDIERNITKLKTIRTTGLGVAIDDFGTGYSSLSYIAKLPVDALKIDRSFIMNMAVQPESMTIVSTIITLAHSLSLKVVAEGVETEEQAKYLTLLKCDEMQGFLFSKPLPPEDTFELLRSGKSL